MSWRSWPLSRGWTVFLGVSALLGLLLRILCAEDMEYKEDEEYNFVMSQRAGWLWVGMPSGVLVPNPGMSVWAFKALALLTRTSTPTGLAHALEVFAWLGACLLLPFILRVLRPSDDRRPWLWAMALAMVNPFGVFYQRKLWPEPFLPAVSMLMLMGWWRRDRALGAFVWGLAGACMGQIHMSGFFFAAGFLGSSLLIPAREIPRSRVRWGAWLAGSALGAIPLLPWLAHVLHHPISSVPGSGWGEIVQAKFWVFWVTDPLGLHLGNPLGLLRGPSTWAQISDFIRYPLWDGKATYLNALAHGIVLGCGLVILASGARRTARLRLSGLLSERSNLELAIISGLWGFGLLLTASGVNIRRYYMLVSFPLELVWLARGTILFAQEDATRTRRWLGALWAGELFISACFVGYVHVNQGATAGDYGEAYHVIMRKRAEGAPVPDYPTLSRPPGQ